MKTPVTASWIPSRALIRIGYRPGTASPGSVPRNEMSVTVRSPRQVSIPWVRPRGSPRRVTASGSPSSSVTAA